MANLLFRDRLIGIIRHALEEFRAAGEVQHPGLQGQIREIALKNLFEPLLPAGAQVGTGKIIDAVGNQSPQIDLIIYNRNILPPLMYTDDFGLFPVESCLYAIEVKSTMTAAAVKDAIMKAREVAALNFTAAEYDERFKPKVPITGGLTFACFAFTSDLKDGSKTELERYMEHDPNSNIQPSIPVFCILQKGYWWFYPLEGKWIHLPPTENYDEVIDFLGGIVNSIHDLVVSRGRPRLGKYLIQPRPFTKS